MRIVLYLLILGGWLSLAKPAFAEQVLFRDDFDDGQADNWTVQRNMQWQQPDQPCQYNGQPAEWNVKEGELGIVISGGGSCTTAITPPINLEPVPNFAFSFDWHFPESTFMDRNVALLWQDEHNWYGVKVVNNEVLLEKVVDGRLYTLTNSSAEYQFSPDQRYHFELSITNNTITVLVDGTQVLQTQDQPPFIRGFRTVGLMASTGAIRRSVSYFDNVVITSLSDESSTQLHVPLLKQSDPSWKHYEYDHAKQWSDNPTIERWGCALTSMVMVLQYYGIDRLPNNQLITPYTLNVWLLEQPDGYLGEGHLNWLSITRLTFLMSSKLHTPKLEYRWSEYKDDVVRKEIQANQPAIINIPGHFLVGDGFNSTGNILIKDPAFSYQTLNEHAEAPLSLRLFTPSQTDLSYILVTHQPTTTVSITDGSHHTPGGINQYVEYVQDFVDEQNHGNTPLMSTVLAKPANETYILTITPPVGQTETLSIYTYTTNGEVTIHQPTVTQPISFLLTLLATNSTLTPQTNTPALEILLEELYAQREIKTKYVFLKLKKTALSIARNDLNFSRYTNLFEKQVDVFSRFISVSGREKLLNRLRST